MSTRTIQFNGRTSSAKSFGIVFSDGAGDIEALQSRGCSTPSTLSRW